jgi:hypothetical protein
VRGCDRNGDLVPQIDELGPSSGFALGSTARYADDLKYPVSNEYNWEVQRQLPGNMVLSLGYTYRQTRRNLGQRNIAVPENTYVPITVFDPVSQQTLVVHNQSPALAGRNESVFDNEEILDSNYIRRRHHHQQSVMSNGWSMMGGASFGKSIGRGRRRRFEQSEFERVPSRPSRQRRALVLSSIWHLRSAAQHSVGERDDAVLQRCARVDDRADRRRHGFPAVSPR